MRIYHLKTCDTCKKAIKALGVFEPELIEIRQDGVPEGVLASLLAEFGEDVVVNRRSTTWRGLDEAMRARPALDLLVEHPTLLKRPVIQDGGKTYIGWSKDTQSALNVG